MLAAVRRLGATSHAAVQRTWDGHSGYVADSDGYRWEVALNPDAVGAPVGSW